VKCEEPPAIGNGQLVDEPLDSYDYGNAVSYRCNNGFSLIGSSTLHCAEDGTFKPDPPKCMGKLNSQSSLKKKKKSVSCSFFSVDDKMFNE